MAFLFILIYNCNVSDNSILIFYIKKETRNKDKTSFVKKVYGAFYWDDQRNAQITVEVALSYDTFKPFFCDNDVFWKQNTLQKKEA